MASISPSFHSSTRAAIHSSKLASVSPLASEAVLNWPQLTSQEASSLANRGLAEISQRSASLPPCLSGMLSAQRRGRSESEKYSQLVIGLKIAQSEVLNAFARSHCRVLLGVSHTKGDFTHPISIGDSGAFCNGTFDLVLFEHPNGVSMTYDSFMGCLYRHVAASMLRLLTSDASSIYVRRVALDQVFAHSLAHAKESVPTYSTSTDRVYILGQLLRDYDEANEHVDLFGFDFADEDDRQSNDWERKEAMLPVANLALSELGLEVLA